MKPQGKEALSRSEGLWFQESRQNPAALSFLTSACSTSLSCSLFLETGSDVVLVSQSSLELIVILAPAFLWLRGATGSCHGCFLSLTLDPKVSAILRKYSSSRGNRSPGFSIEDYLLLIDHLTLTKNRHSGGKKVLENVSGRALLKMNQKSK